MTSGYIAGYNPFTGAVNYTDDISQALKVSPDTMSQMNTLQSQAQSEALKKLQLDKLKKEKEKALKAISTNGAIGTFDIEAQDKILQSIPKRFLGTGQYDVPLMNAKIAGGQI